MLEELVYFSEIVISIIFLAFLVEWVERKTVAKVQRRHGPLITGPYGILQPFADFLKLLYKEDLVQSKVMGLIPVIVLALSLFSILIIPFHLNAFSFPGDFIFLILLFDLTCLLIMFLGVSSKNPFAVIGSMRKTLLFFSYELSFILSVVSFMIFSKALSLSELKGFSPVLIIPFIGYLLSSAAKLEKLPFDISTAEQELIAGYETDLSGRKLAILKLAKNVEFLFVGVFGAALLFGPSMINLLEAIPITFLLSFMNALFPRYRIDQASNWFKYPLIISIIGVLVCLI